jgi:hypothetical protein
VLGELLERLSAIRGVVQNPQAVDEVEGIAFQWQAEDIGLHDVHVRVVPQVLERGIHRKAEIDPDHCRAVFQGNFREPSRSTPDIQDYLALEIF